MDVKYVPADWKKMKSGIGNLIGLGVYGKGMIDDLKDISSNLEDTGIQYELPLSVEWLEKLGLLKGVTCVLITFQVRWHRDENTGLI